MHETLRIGIGFAYCIAALLFIFGSYQYFPAIDNGVVGGWLFTIGSAVFVSADLSWMFRKRTKEETRESLIDELKKPTPEDTMLNDCCALSVSILFLVGSVLFIPSLGAFVPGTWLFVIANIIYITAQCYRMYAFQSAQSRAKTDPNEPALNDPLRPYIDVGFLLAALIYELGTIFFLPSVYDQAHMNFVAALMFVVGSIAELFAAVILLFRAYRMSASGVSLASQTRESELSENRNSAYVL